MQDRQRSTPINRRMNQSPTIRRQPQSPTLGREDSPSQQRSHSTNRNEDENLNQKEAMILNLTPGGRQKGAFLTWQDLTYKIKTKEPPKKKDGPKDDQTPDGTRPEDDSQMKGDAQKKDNAISAFFKKRFAKQKKSEKTILRNCTGYVEPGNLVALMGSSGAGKSTLLDTLASRKTQGKIEGSILANGKPINGKLFRKNVGYVEQVDILLGSLTPRELLQYSALLRLEQSIPHEDKMKRVEQVIKDLGIEHCADTIIGDRNHRGISGGEAKRVNIGLELVTNPPILFLDEPTSGLDSTTSFDVMQVVRKIADSGRAVICTIHQPGADIFALFDRLLLMANGSTVYFGDAEKSLDYFKDMGYNYPSRLNPAEYLIAVISAVKEKQEILKIEGPDMSKDDFVQKWNESQESKEIADYTEKVKNGQTEKNKKFADPFADTEKRYNTGWFYSLAVLTRRNFRSSFRDSSFVGTRLWRNVIFALLTMSYYWGLGTDQNGLYDRASSLFYTITFLGFGAIVFLAKLIDGRALFSRERQSAAYRTSVYYLGLHIVEAPLIFLSVRSNSWLFQLEINLIFNLNST
eukprot:TRINITY_DN2071_c0_g1_i1.p1 TRINITY_DN2071_c0_g1~~TRINITY_DN2071_c0_g1_i1.p1  ORF type:complete len:577 (+),score=145.33 TRINITY_DN2071_c0_g1_i1:83-1813(+)